MNYKSLIFLILIFTFVIFLAHKASFAQVEDIGVMQTVKPLQILIVPGHDDKFSGAQYGNLKEADMNLTLATQIYDILKADRRFDVYITRDSKGYTKEFDDYFTNHKEDIAKFLIDAKDKMQSEIASGSFIQKPNTPHHAVGEDVALRLYGFNNWANENKINAVVHVHFNDYARKTKWTIGNRSGFVIYMPDSQFVNSAGSTELATNIFSELKKSYSTSNYVNELGGLIPDQKLIALGANDTLIDSVNSVLVEYGYIYKFGNSTTRHQAYKNMANLTATGITNYFFNR